MSNTAAAPAVTQKKSSIKNVPISAHPILIFTINNGAAHTRAAEAIKSAWEKINSTIPVKIIEVSALMSPMARFTHVSLYLWLVKHVPRIWGKIDAYQKRQPQTSPEWFYRHHCRKIFELVEEINPSAIIATEVGCGEIAALVKRDLNLEIPLAAVSLDYDADRAWIQPETDFYCLTTGEVRESFIQLGAAEEKAFAFGVPMQSEYSQTFDRKSEKRKVCEWLELPFDKPLLLLSGGGEGLGKIQKLAEHLLKSGEDKSIVVLCGNNLRLFEDCQRLKKDTHNLRVLGWTNRIADLFRAADILISKLGTTFDEACACALPIIALPPPPGAEQVQYELLDKLGIGRAVKTVEEAGEVVKELIADQAMLMQMQTNAENFRRTDAAQKLVNWLDENLRNG